MPCFLLGSGMIEYEMQYATSADFSSGVTTVAPAGTEHQPASGSRH